MDHVWQLISTTHVATFLHVPNRADAGKEEPYISRAIYSNPFHLTHCPYLSLEPNGEEVVHQAGKPAASRLASVGDVAAAWVTGSPEAEVDPSAGAAGAAVTDPNRASRAVEARLPCRALTYPALPCPALICLELEDGGRRGFMVS
jgi:hypothetical protein